MRSKMIALGAWLLLTAAAPAQNKTHTVRQGDTISGIAAQHKVRRADLIAANRLDQPDRLKLGTQLLIPTSTELAGPLPNGQYKVRNGDMGWTVARRYSISVERLQGMNPGIDLEGLQPGQKLNVKVASEPTVTVRAVKIEEKPSNAAAKPTLVAKTKPAANPAKGATSSYTVRSGDNDWVIAHRLGTTASKLHSLNPSVDWRRLQPGMKLTVAGTAAQASEKAGRLTTRYAKIDGDSVTVRRAPSTTAEKVTIVQRGTEVTVLDHENGWYKLKFPKGTVGWVRGDFLKAMSTLSAAASTRSQRTAARADRKQRYAKLTRSKSSTKPSKKKSSGTLVASKSVDSGDVVAKAMSLRGTRYRWGGTSRSGFDCSGFVTNVYKAQGVKLPRTSRDMASVGKTVKKDELKPGDLVFFKTRRSSRINHVGIYAGNGKFVHSSSGKGQVRVDSLNSGYYANRLVKAKRVANSKTASKPASKPAAKPAETPAKPAEAVPAKPVAESSVTVG